MENGVHGAYSHGKETQFIPSRFDGGSIREGKISGKSEEHGECRGEKIQGFSAGLPEETGIWDLWKCSKIFDALCGFRRVKASTPLRGHLPVETGAPKVSKKTAPEKSSVFHRPLLGATASDASAPAAWASPTQG